MFSGVSLGFYCDGCHAHLQMKNDLRFRCDTCEDFDLCVRCYSSVDHRHTSFTLIDIIEGEKEGGEGESGEGEGEGDRARTLQIGSQNTVLEPPSSSTSASITTSSSSSSSTTTTTTSSTTSSSSSSTASSSSASKGRGDLDEMEAEEFDTYEVSVRDPVALFRLLGLFPFP
jgi:hypothetical protein